VITDVRMPGATGFDVLTAVGRAAPATPVVMMTGYATIPEAVAAIKGGAFDYIVKPLDADEVALVVARALTARGSSRPAQVATVREGTDGSAPRFREAIQAARESASRDYLVLLMTQFRGNVTHAAAHAGIARVSLYRLLKKHGVSSEAFRSHA
jgi:DNA-binding NtrC family response regulator